MSADYRDYMKMALEARKNGDKEVASLEKDLERVKEETKTIYKGFCLAAAMLASEEIAGKVIRLYFLDGKRDVREGRVKKVYVLANQALADVFEEIFTIEFEGEEVGRESFRSGMAWEIISG